MDNAEFIKNLGFKEPKDLVKNFTTNIAIHDIITHNMNADVEIKQTRQKVQYIVTPNDDKAREFIANNLKLQSTTIHGKQYKLKVNKMKKQDSVIVEIHPY